MEYLEHGQHFAGSLIATLRNLNPSPEWLNTALRAAGDSRTIEEVCDFTGWSTYHQFRALLEAIADVLGGEEAFAKMGDALVSSPTEIHSLMTALGSPDAIFAEIVGAGGMSVAPVVSVTGEAVGPREWVFRNAFKEGFEPFKTYCAFSRGMWLVVPTVLGLTAYVEEEQCECDGAPYCQFRVRWDVRETASTASLEAKIQALETQLAAQQRTVNELNSGESLSAVLEHIVDSAAGTVIVPWLILALPEIDALTREVYARGLSQDAAEDIVRQLEDDECDEDASRLVVQVASTRRHYGQLIAVNPGGRFFPQQVSLLHAYAGLAAAALDSATALEDSRRQAETAHVLLDLSVALAHITSTSEMAATLAAAVPAVTGCDRSIVALRDPKTNDVRAASAFGFSESVTKWLLSLDIPLPNVTDGEVALYGEREAADSDMLRDIMRRTGIIAFAVIPIVVDLDIAGLVVAGVANRSQRFRDGTELRSRLRGLAGQAATAVRNARLLDQVQHKALHDSLTGLANRELIFGQAEQMLARSRRNNTPTTALFIDLDGFKSVNDAFGHDAGDELIEIVSKRLVDLLRSNDTLGRFGGDEFVALLEDDRGAGSEVAAQRILDALRQPVVLGGPTAKQ